MSNSRSWMWHRLDANGFLSDEFGEGVKQFLDFAYSHPEVVDRGCIRCPCAKCRNMRFDNRETVHYHLIKYGFEHGYTTWDAHGEPWIQKSTGEHSGSRNNEDIGMRNNTEQSPSFGNTGRSYKLVAVGTSSKTIPMPPPTMDVNHDQLNDAVKALDEKMAKQNEEAASREANIMGEARRMA